MSQKCPRIVGASMCVGVCVCVTEGMSEHPFLKEVQLEPSLNREIGIILNQEHKSSICKD